jgi:hypothetical protein
MRLRPLVLAALAVILLPAIAAAQAQPIRSVETNWNGIGLDLMAVERKGSVLTVKWAARNSSSQQASLNFSLAGRDVTTYVVDEENGTKYFVLTDKEGKALATEHEWTGDSYGISEYVEAGGSKRFWAKFPAPPAAVKTLTLIFSNTEPLEEVPITDK